MIHTNYYIDEIIKTNSATGMTNEDRFKFKILIDTTLVSGNKCRLCDNANDPFVNNALENSTMCYSHIRLCMAYAKYLV
jgi:hypothetical protein